MKKLQALYEKWLDKLEERWLALPVRKQRKYTLYFFAGYLLLTAGVILKVWNDTGKSNQQTVIEHIETPFLKKGKPVERTADTTLDKSKQ